MLPGGISQSFAYDNIGRLVDSKTRQSTKVRRERRYHWGKADRLLKTEDSRYGTTSYEYSPTGHLKRQPMPMAQKSIVYRTRWSTSLTTLTASTSKVGRYSSRASGVSSTTRMDNSSRSTKARANGGTANETVGSMSGTRTARSRWLSHPTESDLHSLPTMPSPASVVYLLGSVAKEKTEGTYARRLPYFREWKIR